MKKFIIEFFLILWFLSFFYFWFIIDLSVSPKFQNYHDDIPIKITKLIEKNREIIWPYIYRDYIFK